MKIINIHTRTIHQNISKVGELLDSITDKQDKVWPFEKWPRMNLDKGLKTGSKGGHGPIRYTVMKYIPSELIEFTFTRPLGFDGIHRFEVIQFDENSTEIKHIIDMTTSGMGTIKWIVAVRWLHDALVEDALDKVSFYFDEEFNQSKWSLWVKFLRFVLK